MKFDIEKIFWDNYKSWFDMKRKLIFATAFIIIFVGIIIYFFMNKRSLSPSPEIQTFEECIRMGVRIEESYPKKCWTAEGKVFTEQGVPSPFETTLTQKTAQEPTIDDISPPTGLIRDKITIRGAGFLMNDNDIAFTNSQIGFQGRNTAYLNHVYSQDGKTISFYLPDELGACAMSQIKENEACPMVALSLPKGVIQISVVNKNGVSNNVSFTIK